jgi:long-chain fatty acid transport protein
MNAQLFYTQWDINQYINLINTAAPPPSPQNFKFMLNYRSSLAYLMAVRKQQTDNLGLTLVGMIDNGPERDSLRVINFPSDVQYFLGLSADYKMNETTTLQLTYGHAFSKTRLNNTVTVGANTIPFSTGDVKLNGVIIDLRLKVIGINNSKIIPNRNCQGAEQLSEPRA